MHDGSFPWLILALGFLFASMGVAVAEPAQTREQKLERLVRQDCGSCHGMTLKGGLGPSLLTERVAGLEPEAIAAIILDGVPGTPMPPWRGFLSEDDARWIATYLQNGGRP